MKKIVIAFASLSAIMLSSCSTDGPGTEIGYSILANHSGHTVSIAFLRYKGSERDSLVLRDGRGVSFPADVVGVLGGHNAMTYIYYNGRYRIEGKKLVRGPLEHGAYIKTFIDGEYYRTFTFTPEDYDYAVEHGTDLGEVQPQ